jgi:hypothetical protein
MLMARASRVSSKIPLTSSWSAQSLTSPPAARARFMAATMAVDVPDAAQVHDDPRLAAVDETRKRAPELVDRGHVEIAVRRDHRHSA